VESLSLKHDDSSGSSSSSVVTTKAPPTLAANALTPPASVFSSSISPGNVEENRYFEWFRCRTAKKLPGAFVLDFWATLLQASWTEPAVLHAVLTLSSVHKRGVHDEDNSRQSPVEHKIPDAQEHFMLQHYTKAIRHLQPHFSTKDRTSVRVALIACLVFVCLEYLRGRFKTAQTHLWSGLSVLKELQIPSDRNNNNEGRLWKPSHDAIDNWVADAFSRLHVLEELFHHHSYQPPCLVLQDPGCSEISVTRLTFHSVNETWQQLEHILHKVLHLTQQARQERRSENYLTTVQTSTLLGRQRDLQTKLTNWLDTYESSKKMTLPLTERPGRVSRLLSVYHAMASIMADSCLWTEDESIFDSYTERFVFIVHQSAVMWKLGSPYARPQTLFQGEVDMSRSIADVGWIPPLYYTALKCRVHRIRLQAVRLLESASHREGIWDSKIAAAGARKVMEIEEADFYTGLDTTDDFSLSSAPALQDLCLPTLPQSSRICELKVVLPDGAVDSVRLLYKQTRNSQDWHDVPVFLQYHG
jgi:hypothetical protein